MFLPTQKESVVVLTGYMAYSIQIKTLVMKTGAELMLTLKFPAAINWRLNNYVSRMIYLSWKMSLLAW